MLYANSLNEQTAFILTSTNFSQILTACGVVAKLTELNLRVPQDVSIVSCAQTQLSIEHAIPLTAITRDYGQHLRRATGMLMTLIQNPGRILHERMDNPLVKRQSTGPAPQQNRSQMS